MTTDENCHTMNTLAIICKSALVMANIKVICQYAYYPYLYFDWSFVFCTIIDQYISALYTFSLSILFYVCVFFYIYTHLQKYLIRLEMVYYIIITVIKKVCILISYSINALHAYLTLD